MEETDTLKEALRYYDDGYIPVPVVYGTKKAAVKWQGYQETPPSREQVQKWFSNGKYNVALLTGPSDLAVVDIDNYKGDVAFTPPETELVQKSANGGKHYFYARNGASVKSAAGFQGYDHVDIRAEGGYILVYPSVLLDDDGGSRQYQWIQRGRPSAFPAELVSPPPEVVVTTHQEEGYDLFNRVMRSGFTPGQHNVELSKLARFLYRQTGNRKLVFDMCRSLDDRDPTPQSYDGKFEPTVKQAIEYEQARLSSNETGTGVQAPQLSVSTFLDFGIKWQDYKTEYYLDKWFPKHSLTYMAAPPESFKTWVLLDAAISLALGNTGTKFLNAFAVHPKERTPVLLFQQEDFGGELRQRMDMILRAKFEGYRWQCYASPHLLYFDHPYTAPIFIHEEAELSFDDMRMFDLLQRRIEETQAKVVMIDPFYSLMSTDKYYAEAGLKFVQLKRIRQETGASFLFVHHTTKSGKPGERRSALGSTFVDGGMEGALMFEKRGDTQVRVHASGKFMDKKRRFDLRFESVDGKFITHASEASVDEITNEVELDIVELLMSEGSLTNAQIAAKLDVHRGTITRRLKALVESGHVDRDGNKYRSTE